MLHGEAIVLGMLAESYIACKLKLLPESSFSQIEIFLRMRYSDLFQKSYNQEEVLKYLQFDKKKVEDKVLFALINDIGKAQFDLEVDVILIKEALSYIYN